MTGAAGGRTGEGLRLPVTTLNRGRSDDAEGKDHPTRVRNVTKVATEFHAK